MKKLVIKSPKTIRERVSEHLREMILAAELPQGARLVESQLAQAIGASRTPVREALHNLEREGLVASLPRVGYVVKPVTPEDVEEICQLRVAVETLALTWATAKNRGRLIQELTANLAAAEKALARLDFKAFVDLDAHFHEIIARLSGGRRLLELAQSLRRHMLRYRVQSIYTADNVARAIAGHRAILTAVAEGREEALAQAVRAHLEQTQRDILTYALAPPRPVEERKS